MDEEIDDGDKDKDEDNARFNDSEDHQGHRLIAFSSLLDTARDVCIALDVIKILLIFKSFLVLDLFIDKNIIFPFLRLTFGVSHYL